MASAEGRKLKQTDFMDGLFVYLAKFGLVILLLIAFAVVMHFVRSRGRKNK
jgi:hypothetical protein